jgi:Ran GTPase-activating protein (RanGAP) involved in mRNA processing and transport
MLSALYLDKLNLEMGSAPEKVNNFFSLQKLLSEYLRMTKSLRVISMNTCSMNNDIMSAIGKGLQMNDSIEVLSLKHNMIGDEGMGEVIKAFQENKHIKLRTLDLSSNKLTDQSGVDLAGALQNV